MPVRILKFFIICCWLALLVTLVKRDFLINALESDEQDEELDLWSDGDIDYHQDFTELEGFEGHPATSVAAHIPQFMQDVAAAVDTRLQQLALEPGCVQAQLEVATDDAHAQQLVLAGYGPALEICGATPHVFQNLNQPEMGTLYLRLLHQESGDYWNRMLDDDFAVPAGDHAPDELAAAGADQQDFASELEAFDMLGEELGAASEVEVPESDIWQPGEQELEDIFGDLDGDLLSAPEVNADTGEYLTAPEGEAGATDEVMQVFSEDIFAEDISLELGSEVVEEQTDIDAVFDKLHQVVSDGDDICGLEVEEFSVAEEDIAETAPEADQSPEPVPAVAQVGAQDVPWYIPAGVVFAQSSPSSGEIFPDFLDAFIEEGSSELEKLEDAVAAWERECASEPAYTAVTRILHTIKGIAKGVGLHCYGTLIHNFETLLSAVPRPDAEGETEYFRLVNAWLDAAVRGLDHIRDSRSDIANTLPQPASAALGAAASPDAIAAERELETAIAEPAPEPVVAPQVEAPSKALNDREKQQAKKLADEGARALAAQQSVRITSEKLDQLLNLTNQAQQLGVRTAQGTARSKRSAAEMLGRLSSVRAHIASIADRALRSVTAQGGKPGNRMDALEMDQYSELQEAANILREGVEDLADLVEFASRQNVQVEALLKQQANVISSIGSAIRAARVVPVSRLVPGLRRLVRTVSVGYVIFGIKSIGSRFRETPPRISTISMTMTVKTGLFTE